MPRQHPSTVGTYACRSYNSIKHSWIVQTASVEVKHRDVLDGRVAVTERKSRVKRATWPRQHGKPALRRSSVASTSPGAMQPHHAVHHHCTAAPGRFHVLISAPPLLPMSHRNHQAATTRPWTAGAMGAQCRHRCWSLTSMRLDRHCDLRWKAPGHCTMRCHGSTVPHHVSNTVRTDTPHQKDPSPGPGP